MKNDFNLGAMQFCPFLSSLNTHKLLRLLGKGVFSYDKILSFDSPEIKVVYHVYSQSTVKAVYLHM